MNKVTRMILIPLVTYSCGSSYLYEKQKQASTFKDQVSLDTSTQIDDSPSIATIKSISMRELSVNFHKEIESDTLNTSSVLVESGLEITSLTIDSNHKDSLKIQFLKNLLPKSETLLIKGIRLQDGTTISAKLQFKPQTKLAFLSQSKGSGNFSTWALANGRTGSQAADEVCRQEAVSKGFDGEFAAWVSDSRRNAKDVFANGKGAWIFSNTERSLFAKDLGQLLNGVVLRPLSYFVDGVRSQSTNGDFVFNGTNVDGNKLPDFSSTSYCSDWSSNQQGQFQEIGNSKSSGSFWSKRSISVSCATTSARIYCLQKGDGHEALPDSMSSGARKVFVTSVSGNGNLMSWPDASGSMTGVTAGDSICKSRAAIANLSRANTFKAWISTSSQSAYDRFTNKSGSYIDLQNTQVANSLKTFADGNLETGIAFDEFSRPIGIFDSYVFTGTSVGGTSTLSDCQSWESSMGSDMSTIGEIGMGSARFTSRFSATCDGAARLLCVED